MLTAGTDVQPPIACVAQRELSPLRADCGRESCPRGCDMLVPVLEAQSCEQSVHASIAIVHGSA